MKIAHTRAMIRAALSGALDSVSVQKRSDLQPRRCPARVPACRPTVLQSARDVDERRRLRRAGAEAGARCSVDNFKTFEAERRRGRHRGGTHSLTAGSRALELAFEPVIGLEIHAQLLTASKIFCGCSDGVRRARRTPMSVRCASVCRARCRCSTARAVDCGHHALALALSCTIHETLDLRAEELLLSGPAEGLSDFRSTSSPLATGGVIAARSDYWTPDYDIRHHARAHGGGRRQARCTKGFATPIAAATSIFNRAGTPLIEIVTEPDLRSATDAAAFFGRLRELLVAIGVNDGNMEEGSLRCDANVSVRPAGAAGARHQGRGQEPQLLPVRRRRRIEYEIARQIDARRRTAAASCRKRGSGTRPRGRTVSMRSKEEAHDYRYFPEPDLPPLVVDIGARGRDSGRDAGAAGPLARPASIRARASRWRRGRADDPAGPGPLPRRDGRRGCAGQGVGQPGHRRGARRR